MNIIDQQALTLVGPTGTSLVLDPLALLCPDNEQSTEGELPKSKSQFSDLHCQLIRC